jgi:hypothetical protein
MRIHTTTRPIPSSRREGAGQEHSHRGGRTASSPVRLSVDTPGPRCLPMLLLSGASTAGGGGTRPRSPARNVQTCSVRPAALAGGRGSHRVAAPWPWGRRRQRRAQAGRRQAAMVVTMIQRPLLQPAGCAFPQRPDAPPARRHMLAAAEGAPLDAGWVDRPAARRSDLLHRRLGTADAATCPLHQTPPARHLEHLRLEPLRQGQPPRCGPGAWGWAPRRRHPVAKRGPHRRGVLLATSGQADGDTARGPHPDD